MVAAHLQQHASHGINPGPNSQKAVMLTLPIEQYALLRLFYIFITETVQS